MKSKSFDTRENVINKIKQNKCFDFVKLYKSAAETNVNPAPSEDENKKSVGTPEPSRRERSPNRIKRKKANQSLELSNIENNTSPSVQTVTNASNAKATSTPNLKGAKSSNSNVKSIMKHKPRDDEPLDVSHLSISGTKSKKRNKSVSFMIDEPEEVATKKIKANEPTNEDKTSVKVLRNTDKKFKQQKMQSELDKENKVAENQDDLKLTEGDSVTTKTDHVQIKAKRKSNKDNVTTGADNSMESSEQDVTNENKKAKKANKSKADDETKSDAAAENKPKKSKKKKHLDKPVDEDIVADGEPVTKAPKKERTLKPEVIAEGLENLNIGDNAHTLTDLLDNMCVADKMKRKKNKQKKKKDKLDKGQETADNSEKVPTEEEKEENGEVDREMVKWMKRKWNKDRKAPLDGNKLLSTVLVENLPISTMCNYKSLLWERFSKFGSITSVGVAEVNPTEDTKLVFTTSIHFQDAECATKALEEDNSELGGGRIRVRRPLPPAQTTVFVRSYGELTAQALSSVFTAAGRIRNIQHMVRGKRAMNTAYIEFDGPEAIKKAIKMAEEVQKIAGKKIYVAKYDESRRKIHKSVESTAKEQNGVDSDSD